MFIRTTTIDKSGEMREAVVNTDKIIMLTKVGSTFHMSLQDVGTFEVTEEFFNSFGAR